jgi:lipoxygenase
MLLEKFEMTIGVALAEVLSQHTSEELYLGQRPSEWIDNEEVQQKFEKFNEELQKIEKKIKARNRNPELKNRQGEKKKKKKTSCKMRPINYFYI